MTDTELLQAIYDNLRVILAICSYLAGLFFVIPYSIKVFT